MHEGDRLALPFVEIGDLDLTMREMRHVSIYSNMLIDPRSPAQEMEETSQRVAVMEDRRTDQLSLGNVLGNAFSVPFSRRTDILA